MPSCSGRVYVDGYDMFIYGRSFLQLCSAGSEDVALYCRM